MQLGGRIASTAATGVLTLAAAVGSGARPGAHPAGRQGKTLDVGPGRGYERIEPALADAGEGDTIRVHPKPDGSPYESVALLVRVPGLRIVGVADPAAPDRRVRLSGAGFDFTGIGSVPRAIVQFDPEADGSLLDGFELSGAHNRSHNAAGVRINQADGVTVRHCSILANDMGVMSNGDGRARAGGAQRFESCLIAENGAPDEPGQSHNLYLGGASAVISGCEIRSSSAGHNIKSRAHYTRVEYCWVHGSAHRELDLVDSAGETDIPSSDAVVIGCVLEKAPGLAGNRTVIHFGQDGGADHRGTLVLVHNTMITPYDSPVVDLSAPGARLRLFDNVIAGRHPAEGHQALVSVDRAGSEPAGRSRLGGSGNLATPAFSNPGGIDVVIADRFAFENPAAGDFRIRRRDSGPLDLAHSVVIPEIPGIPGAGEDRPASRLLRYWHPWRIMDRADIAAPRPGAMEWID